MKKAIALFVLLICTSYVGYSQQDKNVNSLISGKWFIQTMEVDNDVMDLTAGNHWMVFHSNGLYQLMLDNEEQVGTWQLDAENELQLDDNFKGSSIIKKLNDKEFMFSILGKDIEYTIALKK